MTLTPETFGSSPGPPLPPVYENPVVFPWGLTTGLGPAAPSGTCVWPTHRCVASSTVSEMPRRWKSAPEGSATDTRFKT